MSAGYVAEPLFLKTAKPMNKDSQYTKRAIWHV
jgi:hypothetical protein